MARLFTYGAEFNSGATTDLDYDSNSGSGTSTYDTGIVRSGNYSRKFVGSASGPFDTRQFTATSNTNNSFYRAYIYVSSLTTASAISIFLGRSAAVGNVINIRLTRDSASTYHLTLNDEQTSSVIGSSSATLNINTWYRLEMSYLYTAGTFSAYIDGVQFASGAGSASKDINTLRWGMVDNATMTMYFDDIAVNDNTGSFQTGLPGSGKVLRLLPSAAGDINTFATQTGGTAGSANNFTRVNETPPDDATTLNGSSAVNQEDLFKIATPSLGTEDTINVVEVWGRFNNNTADTTGSLKFELMKTGSGTKQQSSAIIPNSTTWKMNATAVPKTPPIVAYQDPDSINWEPGLLNNTIQCGYIDSANPAVGGRLCQVTSVSLVIDYTPGTEIPNNVINNFAAPRSVSAGVISIGEKIR